MKNEKQKDQVAISDDFLINLDPDVIQLDHFPEAYEMSVHETISEQELKDFRSRGNVTMCITAKVAPVGIEDEYPKVKDYMILVEPIFIGDGNEDTDTPTNIKRLSSLVSYRIVCKAHFNIVFEEGICTFDDIVSKSDKITNGELFFYNKFGEQQKRGQELGKKCLDEIKAVLRKYDATLAVEDNGEDEEATLDLRIDAQFIKDQDKSHTGFDEEIITEHQVLNGKEL